MFVSRACYFARFVWASLEFHLHSVVLLADIEKAFLQLGIQPSDQDVTRFLWLKDIAKLEVDDDIVVYGFC